MAGFYDLAPLPVKIIPLYVHSIIRFPHLPHPKSKTSASYVHMADQHMAIAWYYDLKEYLTL
jgi:hypothetical protein